MDWVMIVEFAPKGSVARVQSRKLWKEAADEPLSNFLMNAFK